MRPSGKQGYVLIGYERGQPTGTDDDGEWVESKPVADIRAATQQARDWIADSTTAVVQVIDTSTSPAHVTREVWADRHEDIEAPPPPPWYRRGLRERIQTSAGMMITGGIFVAMGILLLTADPASWLAWGGLVFGGLCFGTGAAERRMTRASRRI